MPSITRKNLETMLINYAMELPDYVKASEIKLLAQKVATGTGSVEEARTLAMMAFMDLGKANDFLNWERTTLVSTEIDAKKAGAVLEEMAKIAKETEVKNTAVKSFLICAPIKFSGNIKASLSKGDIISQEVRIFTRGESSYKVFAIYHLDGLYLDKETIENITRFAVALKATVNTLSPGLITGFEPYKEIPHSDSSIITEFIKTVSN